MKQIHFGTLAIEQQPEKILRVAKTMQGIEEKAEITTFIFRNGEGCVLLAGYFQFLTSPPKFEGIDLISGPAHYQRATQAGRMSIEPEGGDKYSCRLRALKDGGNNRPTLANIDQVELAMLADETNIVSKLKDLGAIDIGSAEAILNCINRTRTQLAMTFDSTNLLPIAAAWGITRINALAKKFGSNSLEAL